MQRIKRFTSQYKHLYTLFIFIPLLLWFKYCEEHITPKYIMHTAFDDKIPFIKFFIIPYVIWYFYVAFGLIYVGLISKRDYYKLLIFITAGMSTCYILYMIFPNGHDLRPEIYGDDIFSKTIKFLYSIDTSTNVCPSIHVFNSIGVDAALLNISSHKKHMASFITMIIICLSTLFIKQHCIIDLIYGVILAVIFYIPIYAIPNIKQYKSYYKGREYKLSEIFKIAMNYTTITT